MAEDNGTSDRRRFPVPVHAIDAVKADVEQSKKDKPSVIGILTCGDAGGMVRRKVRKRDEFGARLEDEDGKKLWEYVDDPCDRPSCFGTPWGEYGVTAGRCFSHTERTLTVKEKRKAHFLEVFIKNAEKGMGFAVESCHLASRAIVYFWADQDPVFRKNLDAIRTIARAIATDRIEDLVVEAIEKWKPGASALAQWWLVNQRGYEWKSTNKAAADAAAGQKFVGGQHVHVSVWKMGEGRLRFD